MGYFPNNFRIMPICFPSQFFALAFNPIWIADFHLDTLNEGSSLQMLAILLSHYETFSAKPFSCLSVSQYLSFQMQSGYIRRNLHTPVQQLSITELELPQDLIGK